MSLATTLLPTVPGESAGALEVLEWGFETFGDRLAICTGFQASGMVILDLAHRISPDVRVFTIDTGRLPGPTYELIEDVRRRYGIEIETVAPDAGEVANMVSAHGPNLFYDSVAKRRMCCEVRKVRPLQRKLAGLSAWVVGLRRGQSESRQDVPKVQADPEHKGLFKLCPLADWTDDQVWDHVRRHDVPVHKLYSEGYTSIGCAPCTRAPLAGEDARAGRWWWENDAGKECGIHYSPDGVPHREFDVLLADVLRPAS